MKCGSDIPSCFCQGPGLCLQCQHLAPVYVHYELVLFCFDQKAVKTKSLQTLLPNEIICILSGRQLQGEGPGGRLRLRTGGPVT